MDELLELGKMEATINSKEQKREKLLSELVDRLKIDTFRLLEDIIRKELRLVVRSELRDIIRGISLETFIQKGIAEESEKIETEALYERSQKKGKIEESEDIVVMLENLESEVKASIEGGEDDKLHLDS